MANGMLCPNHLPTVHLPLLAIIMLNSHSKKVPLSGPPKVVLFNVLFSQDSPGLFRIPVTVPFHTGIRIIHIVKFSVRFQIFHCKPHKFIHRMGSRTVFQSKKPISQLNPSLIASAFTWGRRFFSTSGRGSMDTPKFASTIFKRKSH